MTTGSVSRPWLPSQYSVLPDSSAMECRAQNSAPTVRRVASSATALAPFSQNSAGLRLPCRTPARRSPGSRSRCAGSGAAASCTVRDTPAWAIPRSSATVTALTPAAAFFGACTSRSSSLMSSVGAGRVIFNVGSSPVRACWTRVTLSPPTRGLPPGPGAVGDPALLLAWKPNAAPLSCCPAGSRGLRSASGRRCSGPCIRCRGLPPPDPPDRRCGPPPPPAGR